MDPQAQRAHTYILDPESPVELAREMQLDLLSTRVMGGPLSGVPSEVLEGLHDVLDLACGPGGWVLDVAYENPEAQVTGIDSCQSMVDYARARAWTQKLSNASFEQMDLTQPLEFADQSFDLVNGRFLGVALPSRCWPALLAECTRLLRPGGILRLTEMVNVADTTSPAFARVHALVCRTLRARGYGFSPDGNTLGLTAVLPSLLRQAGYPTPQIISYAVDCSSGTPEWIDVYRNCEVGIRLLLPQFVKQGLIGVQEMEELYQQMLIEMNEPSFCGMWSLLTVWGVRPHES